MTLSLTTFSLTLGINNGIIELYHRHGRLFKPFSGTKKSLQWKGINCKQSTRWQQLSRLKASAFFSLQNFFVVMKRSNLYLGLVLPSGGWQSLIIGLVWGTTQGRQADKAGRLTRQASWQGRQADKADRLTRQPGWQGRQADKADRLTRQAGGQGKQANKAGTAVK
jgi:hypothetical protein